MDDYAFLIKGLLDLYEASLDLKWLNWARQLQLKQNEIFWDDENGGYFTCSTEDSTVVLRLKEGITINNLNCYVNYFSKLIFYICPSK